jgi:hypothetical protein
MPLAGFEPAIPVNERPQTQVLDSAATGFGIIRHKIMWPILNIKAVCILALIISLSSKTYLNL